MLFNRVMRLILDPKSIRKVLHATIEDAKAEARHEGTQYEETVDAIFEGLHSFVDDLFRPERRSKKSPVRDWEAALADMREGFSRQTDAALLGAQIRDNLEWQKAYDAWNELGRLLLVNSTTGVSGIETPYEKEYFEITFDRFGPVARAMERLDDILKRKARPSDTNYAPEARLGQTDGHPLVKRLRAHGLSFKDFDSALHWLKVNRVGYSDEAIERWLRKKQDHEQENTSTSDPARASQPVEGDGGRQAPDAPHGDVAGPMESSVRGHEGQPVVPRMAGQARSAGDSPVHQRSTGDVGVRGSRDGAGVIRRVNNHPKGHILNHDDVLSESDNIRERRREANVPESECFLLEVYLAAGGIFSWHLMYNADMVQSLDRIHMYLVRNRHV